MCHEPTTDLVYAGRVKSCGRPVYFGRCCKPELVEQFGSLKAAGIALAKLHTIACGKARDRQSEILVDLTDEDLVDESVARVPN